MSGYTCPQCYSSQIEVHRHLVQEIDLDNGAIVGAEPKQELVCLHCHWRGTDLQTTQQGVAEDAG